VHSSAVIQRREEW